MTQMKSIMFYPRHITYLLVYQVKILEHIELEKDQNFFESKEFKKGQTGLHPKFPLVSFILE